MGEALTDVVDPRAYIAAEMTSVDDQPLTGDALERTCRAYDVYARLLGLGPDVTGGDMLDFDFAFFTHFDEDGQLVDEWEWSGAKFEEDMEDGVQLRNVVVLTTADGYTAFIGEDLPEPLIALARDGRHPEIRFTTLS